MKRFRLFPEEDGYIPHLWLAYYYFTLLYLIGEQGFRFWFPLLVMIIIFFCYREIYWRPERTFSSAIILTILVAYLVFFIEQTFFYLLLYAINMLYVLKSPAKFWIGYMTVNAVTGIMLFTDIYGIHDWTWGFISPGILISLITPAVWKVQEKWYRKWEAVNEELTDTKKQVEELIKERERDRIARDLHDTVGQALSTISVKSDISKKLLFQNPGRAEQELHDIQQLSRSLLQEMREIVSDMRLVSLQEEYEAAQLRLKEAGIASELEQQLSSIEDSSKETMLAYILKEAVTNVIRHSNATFCKIRVIQTKNVLHLQVEDNGGYDNTFAEEGNGLDGIRKRVSLMKGEAHFHERPNGGLHMIVKVPMQTEGGNSNDSYAVGG
ncbi:sensor histidine kinase [Terribacillus goriensis]|uniref:sensor histidine kinase n=1 Tax=Terribacillus saccharophilus TaxID=361277 RepID=UPI003983830D